jgi:hypothetical protein
VEDSRKNLQSFVSYLVRRKLTQEIVTDIQYWENSEYGFTGHIAFNNYQGYKTYRASIKSGSGDGWLLDFPDDAVVKIFMAVEPDPNDRLFEHE